MGVRSAMRQAQDPLERGRHAEAGTDRGTQDVLHVDRLALADECAIEHGVKDIALGLIAIGQVEIIRPDTVAPGSQGETEIVALSRRNHQRMRAAALAAAIGLRLGQALRHEHAATGIGDAAREQTAGAAVSDADRRIGDRLARIEMSHPGKAPFPAPFEMHRHVGDERRRRDIARRLAAEQRLAEHRTGQLDNIESGLAERDADHLEILALAGQADLQRRTAGSGEDRSGAGVVDGDRLGPLLDLMALVTARLVDGAQPFGDLAVQPVDAQRLAGDRHAQALQRRLDVAHGDGKDALLLRLEDTEGRGELHQRRRLVETDIEREALGIGQRPAALVLDPGGQGQLCGGRGRQRRGEGDVADRRLLLFVLVEHRRDHLAVGGGHADLLRHAHRNRRGETHISLLDGAAPGLGIDA
ncbi:hypothetical protein MGWOODY_Smn3527 [hydrothermal vent metagenome]|uniref:Uncharacterized protein n=1 Tax=hydrothermal vent metagenome TaxID=652676 RepID=A0A160TRL9_9ZZZZ